MADINISASFSNFSGIRTGDTATANETRTSYSNLNLSALTGSLFGTSSFSRNAHTASYINFSNISDTPALVSSSAQILTGSAVWSSSAQLPAGIISSSAQVTMSQSTSASYATIAATASYVSGTFVDGGNSFGSTASFGTNNANPISIKTNNLSIARFEQNGDLFIGSGSWLGSSIVSGRGISIQKSGSVASFVGASIAAGAAANVHFEGEIASGTPSGLLPAQSGSSVLLAARNYDGTGWFGGAQIALAASQNWSAGSHGSFIRFNTITSGSSGTPLESMRIMDNGSVGIGCSNPSASLVVSENVSYTIPIPGTIVHVVNSDNPSVPTCVTVDTAGDTNVAARLAFRRSRGTISSPNPILTSDVIGTINSYGTSTSGSAATISSVGIAFRAEQDFSAGSGASRMEIYTTPSGSISNIEAMRIDSSGDLVVGGGAWSGLSGLSGRGIVIQKSKSAAAITILTASGSVGGAITSGFEGNLAGGSLSALTSTYSGSNVSFSMRGYDSSGWGIGSYIAHGPTQTWSLGSHASNTRFHVVASGSTSPLEVMRIESTGFVGMGTIAPAATLHVSGSSILGYNQTNTHQFTGSLRVTGSVALSAVSSTGANTATLTNSPVTGNPTGWVQMNINGTNRWIPYW